MIGYDTQSAYEAIRTYFTRYGAQLAKSEGGNKCAVGCLIPDVLYDEGLECWLMNNPALAVLFKNVDLRFIRSAQILHDVVAEDARTFVIALDVLALAYGLNVQDSCFAHDELLTGEAKTINVEVTVADTASARDWMAGDDRIGG